MFLVSKTTIIITLQQAIIITLQRLQAKNIQHNLYRFYLVFIETIEQVMKLKLASCTCCYQVKFFLRIKKKLKMATPIFQFLYTYLFYRGAHKDCF